MKDLQPFKNSLMSLTYEEKIQMSEWLHTQIDFERAEYVKEKGKQVSEQIGKFADKAAQITKTAGGSLMDMFKGATQGNVPGSSSTSLITKDENVPGTPNTQK